MSGPTGHVNSAYHYNRIKAELTTLQRRRDQRQEELERLKRKARDSAVAHVSQASSFDPFLLLRRLGY